MGLGRFSGTLIALAFAVLSFAPNSASALSLYAGDLSNNLWVVDSTTGSAVAVGSMGPGVISDLAVSPSGDLFATGYSTLYRVDKATGAKTAIGSHGINGANALAFDANGLLYVAGGSQLARFDVSTGVGSVIGRTGFNSSGDIAFGADGVLYQTVTGSFGDKLIVLDTNTGIGKAVGDTGYGRVFGLESDGGNLIGLTASGNTISIDPKTGAAIRIASGGIAANGAARVGSSGSQAVASGLPNSPIPEPVSLILFAAGALLVGFVTRQA